MRPIPPVPGVRDLVALLDYLEKAKDREKWLKDAKAVLKENQKAVRLLGATDKIEKDLAHAERLKVKAERAMDSARAASESLIEETGEDLRKREALLQQETVAFSERMKAETDALKAEKAEFEAMKTREQAELDRQKAAIEASVSDISAREKAAAQKERRAEARASEAREMKEEARKLTASMQAVLKGQAA